MEICSSLLLETITILAVGGTFQRRRGFGRDVLLGHCCLLMLLIFCWQQSLAEGRSWGSTTKLYKSDDDYYESDDSYESEDEDEKYHETGQINLGASNLNNEHDSVEIEYEEHDHHHHHHLPNGVSDESGEDQSDSFNNPELLAQLGLDQKGTRKGKKKGRKHRAPPVTIAVPYPVHIERKVPVFIEKKVPVIVEKKVEVPVDRPYEVPVPVKVPVHEKEVIHVPKPIVFNVDRPYPVYVHRTVFVEKYRPFKVLIKSRTRY